MQENLKKNFNFYQKIYNIGRFYCIHHKQLALHQPQQSIKNRVAFRKELPHSRQRGAGELFHIFICLIFVVIHIPLLLKVAIIATISIEILLNLFAVIMQCDTMLFAFVVSRTKTRRMKIDYINSFMLITP